MSGLPVIVLAAGQSRRMRGRDKLMEEVEGLPLVARQARLARAITDGPVIVALPPPPHPRHEALRDLDVARLSVPDAGEGMGASLRRAVAALPEAPAAMILLGDLPDLTAPDLIAVLDAVEAEPGALVWRGTTEDGRPGHPIVFARALWPAFAELKGDSGGQEVVAAARGRVHLVPLPGTRARADLDTPEDWAAWRAARAKE